MVAVHSSNQVSRVCSGTWLWTKRVQRSGSRPTASRLRAASSVLARSVGGFDVAGQGVQVDHAVEGVVGVLQRDPVTQGPEIVPEREVPRRRDAREGPFHGPPW